MQIFYLPYDVLSFLPTQLLKPLNSFESKSKGRLGLSRTIWILGYMLDLRLSNSQPCVRRVHATGGALSPKDKCDLVGRYQNLSFKSLILFNESARGLGRQLSQPLPTLSVLTKGHHVRALPIAAQFRASASPEVKLCKFVSAGEAGAAVSPSTPAGEQTVSPTTEDIESCEILGRGPTSQLDFFHPSLTITEVPGVALQPGLYFILKYNK